ncbi:MAG: MBL fold metallo-hydrolase [Myxococcota bacterium]
MPLARLDGRAAVLYSRLVGQAERFHDAQLATRAERAPVTVVPGLVMLALRTPTLPPATHTNTFLVGAGDGAVLVEPASPYPEELERVGALVDEAAGRGVHPRAILVTHHHADHVGGALKLQEHLRLPLWAHRATIERLEGRVPFDRAIEDGERIPVGGAGPAMELVAVHTPGHAPGHLCFLEPATGTMIAGDMVAGIGTIVVEPTDGDMGLYLESLRKMIEAGAETLLPAHGGPITEAAACVEYYIQHRLERERKVLQALQLHPEGVTAPALLPDAYGDAPKAVWPLALQSVQAHLLKLEGEGRARRGPDERWRPA